MSSQFRDVIVIMTALVPTYGHARLIDFASQFAGPWGRVIVKIYGRDEEPIKVLHRRLAFSYYFPYGENYRNIRFISENTSLPDSPVAGEEAVFWNDWSNEIKNLMSVYDISPTNTYIIASETYGETLAEHSGIKFIPCDMARASLPIKGTSVRTRIKDEFQFMLPYMQEFLRVRVCLFGAESTGKTTLAKSLARHYQATFVPEWAREYLELPSVGVEVTDEKMDRIHIGQKASMKSISKIPTGHSVIFFDTDLFSTIGYHRLRGSDISHELVKDAISLKSDLYLLTHDDVPFEPDPLRYGGDKRESDTAFWRGILEEFGLNYVELPAKRGHDFDKAVNVTDLLIHNKFEPIRSYVRV